MKKQKNKYTDEYFDKYSDKYHDDYSDLDNSSKIHIRAHHLLCIQGFQGLGYSAKFVENMKELIHHLQLNPHTPIELVTTVDDICLYCPHQKNESCAESVSSDARIISMDLKVLEYLGLQKKEVHSYKNLLVLLHEKIDFLKLKDICGSCSWTETCIYYDKLNKNR